MKKSLLSMLFIALTVCAFAQQKVGQYHSDFHNEDFDIEASLNKNGHDFSLYIAVSGEAKKNYFQIESKNIPALLSSLRELKAKFIEWCQVAKDNNVTEMNKEMSVKFPSMNAAWLGTKYFFNFGFKPTFSFLILNKTKCVASCYHKLTSSSNRYIDNKFYWTFESIDDFDAIINALDENAIRETLTSQSSKEDLFK